jgi:hypothetical protein
MFRPLKGHLQAKMCYKTLKCSSAPVLTGNTFQDIPRLCAMADNTERYI